jgi:O-antigen/teichoic acid export membrane protein
VCWAKPAWPPVAERFLWTYLSLVSQNSSLQPDASQRIVRNSAGNLLALAVNAFCNLLVVFALARYLGKELLGQYFTVFAVLMAVQMILESGITTMLTCRIVQCPDIWRRTVAEATGLLVLVVMASVGSMAGIGFAWSRWRDDPTMYGPYLAASFACAALQVERFCSAVFRAFEQFRYENIGRVIQGTFFGGSVIGCCMLGIASPAVAMAMLGVSHVAAAIFLIMKLQLRWRCLGWRLDLSVVKDWLREAVPIGMGDVVRRLTWQLDTLLLGAMQSPGVVGIYSVAYRPLGPLNWVPRAILTAAFPSFARMAATDRESLDRIFANSTRLLWVISLPIAIAICLSAKPLILFLAGSEFLESATPMQVLIWISTLSFLSIQFRFLYTAVGRQQLFARLALVIFLIEAAIEALLIPFWGYMGACAGSLVGELVFTLAGLAFCSYFGLGRIPWAPMFRAGLAGFVMGAIIWPGRDLSLIKIIPLIAVASLVYVLLCILLGALHWVEVRQSFDALFALARIKPHKSQPSGIDFQTNKEELEAPSTV